MLIDGKKRDQLLVAFFLLRTATWSRLEVRPCGPMDFCPPSELQAHSSARCRVEPSIQQISFGKVALPQVPALTRDRLGIGDGTASERPMVAGTSSRCISSDADNKALGLT